MSSANHWRIFCGLLLWACAAVAQEDTSVATLAEEDPSVVEQVQETLARDKAIEKSLAARLARVDALQEVSLEVTAGVVTLRGLVDEEANRELAAQLAKTVEGVVAVNNRLQFDRAVNRRLAPVLADGWDRLKRLLTSLPLVLVALLLVYLAYALGRFITRWQRPFSRFRNPFLADLVRQALQLAFTAAGVLVALNLLGATAVVSAVLGAAGIVGLALGFAFRDLVENYIAGILLSIRQPFAPNDHVVIEGHEGRVAALTSRATSLITLEGNHLRLPNALVFKGVILNYTRNPTRLFAFDMHLGIVQDVARVQRIAVAALQNTQAVLAKPPPAALVKEITATGAVLTCTGWVDQRESNFYKVQSEAIRKVRLALDKADALPDQISRVTLTSGHLEPDANASEPRAAVEPSANQEPSAKKQEPSAGQEPSVRQKQEPSAPLEAEEDLESDVAIETHIEDQLESERRTLARQNLLRSDAPRE